MITELQIQNFKSWADTGKMCFAPITGLFGANSSGKSSILQFFLMLKQTVESTDRARTLNLGGREALIDLGTIQDILSGHDLNRSLKFQVGWDQTEEIKPIEWLSNQQKPLGHQAALVAQLKPVGLENELPAQLVTEEFFYHIGQARIGMQRIPPDKVVSEGMLPVSAQNYRLVASWDPTYSKKGHIPAPLRFYGFPNEVYETGNPDLAQLVSFFQKIFYQMHYLGPIREVSRRTFVWTGDDVQNVGIRGEDAYVALLAARRSGRSDVETTVARWLKMSGMIHDFRLQPIATGRREYEVRVKVKANSPEVAITDVGFGVSQVLPVLVLCYYVPEGSIVLLEQPEIHLHPAVQSILADVFIDVALNREVQIILESHSEHLLERLQRRIAEEQIASDQVALYFCQTMDGASRLTPLQLDAYGNINNWPEDFFGDQMGEASARTLAAIDRELRDQTKGA